MKNITFSADEKLIHQARTIAREKYNIECGFQAMVNPVCQAEGYWQALS